MRSGAASSRADLEDLIQHMEEVSPMRPIAPACLVKIVDGAVKFAQFFGFPPHPDYRHARVLLQGVDPSACPTPFTFGRDGKPFYMRGPNESLAEAAAISERVQQAGGHYIVGMRGGAMDELAIIEQRLDQLEASDDEDESLDESL